MKQTENGRELSLAKNSIRKSSPYQPSKPYFARIRIGGKLIRRTLKTRVLSVAKLRLGDLENKERDLSSSGCLRACLGGRSR
jgi:hypothetical protein